MKNFVRLFFLCFLLAGLSRCEATDRVVSKEVDDGKDGGNPGATDTDTDSDGDDDGDFDAGSSSDDGCSSMDILFVIDDSDSMKEEQDNLIANFPKFIEVLEAYKTSADTQLEYRVGVTTTGVVRKYTQQSSTGFGMPQKTDGPDGALQGQSKCGLDEPWIDGPGPDVADDFSCIANVGIEGEVHEMPFAAMQLALGTKSESGGPNEGFYRRDEDSLLVVVFITDEDDCSVEEGGTIVIPLSSDYNCGGPKDIGIYKADDMKAWLDDLAGGTGRYVVIGIAGIDKCDSSFGGAKDARRIEELIEKCGEYGVMGDICSGDLWISLDEALDIMKITCEDMPTIE